MADLLRRELAPLTRDAWVEIDDTAKRVLKSQLSARTVVDVDGPHGWTHGGVNLGRLKISKEDAPGGVPWGIRELLPLIEVRVPFTLEQLEVDNISRGCQDADLESLEQTARNVALFEETAIYAGFAAGHVAGMIQLSAHKAERLTGGAKHYAQAVAGGVEKIQAAGIAGPYALVLGSGPYHALMQSSEGGYPPRRIIRDMLAGPILWSPALDGGVLLSTRGGDFELTIGQDLSIGYASHSGARVELFLTESFAFRVLEPAAVVELKPEKG